MISKPLFFERNRVFRVYTGGALFSPFFGDAAEDGYFPEEWIASAVRAINKEPIGEKDGVSCVLQSKVYFDDLLKAEPEALLGKAGKLRILVKALDSAIRLPAQAHPDRPFSRRYFGSEYGKTECWIILGTRPGAKIFFGFKDGVTEEDFEAAIDASETDPHAMEALMRELSPRVGEVYLVPAKTVHAIGAGCLILEVQEPTDFTIQPERYCGEYRLSDGEMYLGLSRSDAVSCFSFGEPPKAKIDPRVSFEGEGVRIEALIDRENTECFVINRITLSGGTFVPSVPESYGIYIVTEGNGVLCGEGYERPVQRGDYFFMPASLMGSFALRGDLSVVECY